ncbi:MULTISPECIES: hypothetical protein [unclassified Microcoleus]|uniref:hypothetical protein n=1 Tax=unclassified Microcoleus TaxID=2642155 RepID=UPI0025F7FE56|nr:MULTISPECIES: hypothetical protein [unclassified Microcoleus]
MTVAVFQALTLVPISRLPKFDRKTIALSHLKFESNFSNNTKPEICQGYLANNSTRAIEIREVRSPADFLAVTTVRQFAKPISVTR